MMTSRKHVRKKATSIKDEVTLKVSTCGSSVPNNIVFCHLSQIFPVSVTRYAIQKCPQHEYISYSEDK